MERKRSFEPTNAIERACDAAVDAASESLEGEGAELKRAVMIVMSDELEPNAGVVGVEHGEPMDDDELFSVLLAVVQQLAAAIGYPLSVQEITKGQG